MKKIILKNCDTREVISLFKKSSSLDNFIFINTQLELDNIIKTFKFYYLLKTWN